MIPLPALSMKVWAMIGAGAIIAALVVALLITRNTLSETKRDRDEYALKLSVSNASINTMEREIKRMVAEQKALAESDANRINSSRQIIKMADAVAKVREAAIDKLNASAEMIRPADTTGQCMVSEALKEQWPA